MKKLLVISLVFFISSQTFVIKGQTVDDPTVLKSAQGKWVDKPDGVKWTQIEIKGDSLTYFEAWPSSGKWSEVRGLKIIQSAKVSSRSSVDGKLIIESFIKIEEGYFNYTRLFLKTDKAGKKYLTFEGYDPKYMKVALNFTPWN